jgi:hypothetical protein
MHVDPNFKSLSTCMFSIWDANHKLHTWLPYVKHVHNDEPSWHIYMDFIILDTSHEFVELLTTMMDLNK